MHCSVLLPGPLTYPLSCVSCFPSNALSRAHCFGVCVCELVPSVLSPCVLSHSCRRAFIALCCQVADTYRALVSALPRGTVTVLECSGAGDATEEARAARRGAHVLVATPGKMLKLLQWGAVPLAGVATLVLDEADEMMSRFTDELHSVFGHLTADAAFTGQVVLVSATMDDDTLQQVWTPESRLQCACACACACARACV